VVDHYRRYMVENRKSYEHERYRIDKIKNSSVRIAISQVKITRTFVNIK
jgi:hypothetical protein